MNADEQRVTILAARLAHKRDWWPDESETLVRRALQPARPDDDYELSSVRAWIAAEDCKEALWQAVRPVAEPVLNWLLAVTQRMKRRARR